MSDDDRIVFPGQDYDHQDSRPEASEEDTTSRTKRTAIIVVSVVLGTLLLALIVFFIYRRYRRKTREAKEKLDRAGYDHISLPFLGTKYEIISRKSSQVSELSQPQPQVQLQNGGSQQATGLDVFDGRVSRYIDADVTLSNSLTKDQSESEDPRGLSFQTILDETLENIPREEVSLSPPRAEPEESCSTSSLSAPALALTPPSPKERPKSDNFEAPPWIPIKRVQAKSERSLETRQHEVEGRLAGSESVLAQPPVVPPKLRPLVPPKQNINKSQEDITRINKEIQKVSTSSVTGVTGVLPQKAAPLTQAPVTDEDYDFPAASSEAHEWEEYDEPCPVLPNTGHLGPDQDYDDPVQRY